MKHFIRSYFLLKAYKHVSVATNASWASKAWSTCWCIWQYLDDKPRSKHVFVALLAAMRQCWNVKIRCSNSSKNLLLTVNERKPTEKPLKKLLFHVFSFDLLQLIQQGIVKTSRKLSKLNQTSNFLYYSCSPLKNSFQSIQSHVLLTLSRLLMFFYVKLQKKD